MKARRIVALVALSASVTLNSRFVRAQSIPMKNTSCADKTRITAVPNGNGVFWDAECKVAFVLPPVTAHIALTQISGTHNISQCAEWNNFNAEAITLTNRMRALTDTLNAGSGDSKIPKGGPPVGGPFAGSNRNSPPKETVAPDWTPAMKAELDEIGKLYTQVREWRKSFDGITGAKAQFLYTLGTQQLVSAYQVANPSVHFEAMPFSSAYLTFNGVDRGASQSTGSLVLSLSVPGLGKLPDLPDPFNLNPQGARVDSGDPQTDLKYSRMFGSSLSGDLELTLAGACPYFDASTQKLPTKLPESTFTAYMAANLQYSYALQVYRSYKATYNLASLVKKVMSSESHGGMFSSKTLNSYVEEEKSTDWFKFESTSNDPRYYYPYIVQEIKSGLMDRMVKQVASAKMGGPIEITGLDSPHADGAATAAKSLHSCPHFYCQVGAFIFDVADAAFGSKNATNSFISNNDFWAIEEVTEFKMIEYFGSAGAVGSSAKR